MSDPLLTFKQHYWPDALRNLAVCDHQNPVSSVNGQFPHLGAHGDDNYLKKCLQGALSAACGFRFCGPVYR